MANRNRTYAGLVTPVHMLGVGLLRWGLVMLVAAGLGLLLGLGLTALFGQSSGPPMQPDQPADAYLIGPAQVRTCPDGECTALERREGSCPADCSPGDGGGDDGGGGGDSGGASCNNNGICEPDIGEASFNCGDCPSFCGDRICAREEIDTCLDDCPPEVTCGDGICSSFENHEICPEDCPEVTPEVTEEPPPPDEPKDPLITEEPRQTEEPTDEPTEEPTEEPTQEPTDEPTEEPTDEPTEEPAGSAPGDPDEPDETEEPEPPPPGPDSVRGESTGRPFEAEINFMAGPIPMSIGLLLLLLLLAFFLFRRRRDGNEEEPPDGEPGFPPEPIKPDGDYPPDPIDPGGDHPPDPG